MEQFINNLKRQVEENPVLALGVAAGLITAIGKLIDSSGNARNSKAWEKEVDRRVRQSQK